MGMGQGFFWASVAAQVRDGSPLFCPPSRMTFTGDVVLSTFNSYIETGYKSDDRSSSEPIGKTLLPVAMLRAFTYTFPCED